MENLRKLQLKELEILKEFINICQLNNLKYYVIGGTLLGAVRHNGFIPWDDDIDVAMPREDYEKFFEIMQENHNAKFEIIKSKKIKEKRDYYYFYYKFINKDVEVVEKQFEKEGATNAWIDIMAIDEFPEDKIKYFFIKKKLLWYRLCMGLYNIQFTREKNNRTVLEKIAIKFGRTFDVGKFINPEKILNKIKKTFKKVDKEKSKKSGTIFGSYGMKELVNKKYWGNGKKYKFEDIYVNCPTMTQEYLTHIYGEDFMELPPEDKRQTYHIKLIERGEMAK